MTYSHASGRLLALAVLTTVLLTGCNSDVEEEQAPSGNSPNGGSDQGSPPVIWGDPADSVLTGSQYIFAPESDDPDGDVLTFEIVNMPDWAAFDETNGMLHGVPDEDEVGVHSDIVISVTDGSSVVSLPGFSITVDPVLPPDNPGSGSGDGDDDNSGDVGDGDDGGGSDGSGDDGDGDSGGNDSGGDDGDGDNGGNDGGGDDGGDDGDGGDGGNASSPPSITGIPNASVVVGSQYNFRPNANDPDGDTLSFSIVNKPSWATFSTTSGRLRGTPGNGDVGTTANIQLSVSDGNFIDALAPFSITVEEAAVGSITISWTAPMQNDDGSPLTNLAGYRFYYGTASGEYSETIEVDSPGITSYVIENLAHGRYYLVMTSVNAADVESEYSSELTFEVGD